jgi:hypothetical protein
VWGEGVKNIDQIILEIDRRSKEAEKVYHRSTNDVKGNIALGQMKALMELKSWILGQQLSTPPLD